MSFWLCDNGPTLASLVGVGGRATKRLRTNLPNSICPCYAGQIFVTKTLSRGGPRSHARLRSRAKNSEKDGTHDRETILSALKILLKKIGLCSIKCKGAGVMLAKFSLKVLAVGGPILHRPSLCGRSSGKNQKKWEPMTG